MKIPLLTLLSLCTLPLYAQNLPNTLLWKISGHGLTHPSYLYGTMHLTDSRLFNFGDSLYAAIQQSDGFALELDPAEMSTTIIEGIGQNSKAAQRIKDILSTEDYQKYSEPLSKKLSMPADEITTQHIFREKNKWISEVYKKGDMETFMDAYLCGIARRQGKWVGGVENTQDQLGLVNQLVSKSDIRQVATGTVDDSKAELERMISIYLADDLNALGKFMSGYDSLSQDKMLIQRNQKMALQMDSLSRVRSIVYAIGAAHLPGSKGLIALLRERGFTVEPVFSSKKIKPAQYKVKEVETPWVAVHDKYGFYQVMMPGVPSQMKAAERKDIKMYVDILTNTAYMTIACILPYDQTATDTFAQNFINKIFKQSRKEKAIKLNGIKGREIYQSDDKSYQRGYILTNKGVVYAAVAISNLKNKTTEKEINKFLNSFQIFEKEVIPVETDYTYVDTALAYKVIFPVTPNPKIKQKSADISIRSNLVIATNRETGASFAVSTAETNPGYFLWNDSTMIELIRENTASRFDSITLDTTYLFHNNRTLLYKGTVVGKTLTMRFQTIMRGNRWHNLVAAYGLNTEDPAVDRFFNSFELVNYPQATWRQALSPDSLFTAWVPSSIAFFSDSTEVLVTNDVRYNAYDTTRSDTYSFLLENFEPYYWENSDSLFWEKTVKNIFSADQILLSRKEVANGATQGVEIEYQEPGSIMIHRRRLLLYGNELVSLTAGYRLHDYNKTDQDKFFTAFRFNRPAPVCTLFTSKTAELLRGLTDTDTTMLTSAFSRLGIAPFTASDLPLLHEALLKHAAQDENPEVFKLIAEKIKALHDPSSFSFAVQQYPKTTNEDLKLILLRLMASFPTTAHYATLKHLLLQFPPKKEPDFLLFLTLEANDSLTHQFFPEILQLLKDTATFPLVIQLSANLLDSNRLDPLLLRPYEKNILDFATKRHQKLESDESEYDYADLRIILVLSKLNSPQSRSMLEKWLHLPEKELQIHALSCLLDLHQAIDQKVLDDLAADRIQRKDLYKILNEHQQIQLFPAAYHTQAKYAETLAYNAFVDTYEGEPGDLLPITQKIVPFKGNDYRFFFFKATYEYEDSEGAILVCAGPFPIDEKDLSVEETIGVVDDATAYEDAQAESQMEALVKSMETWYVFSYEMEKK